MLNLPNLPVAALEERAGGLAKNSALGEPARSAVTRPSRALVNWSFQRAGWMRALAHAWWSCVACGLLSLAGQADAQVYRCGNSYSNAPCAGGKAVDVSPPTSWGQASNGAQALYLCQAFGGGQFWTTEHCRQRNALVERIENVPRDMPFDQQVELARQRVAEARTHTMPPQQGPTGRQPPISGAGTADQCRALDERVKQLDAMARAGGYAQHMDWIAHERKIARDRQFRLRC
ncbi:hypothetical protein [Pseudorhodoferax sp.]|uniref:hypothetical protein n=1 Tax=Pseudorhodoferax sp. TaxID=1993553 RepID=UPI002DD63BA1|nr:hypothetical protein [Pseudorhodoferax sp.]